MRKNGKQTTGKRGSGGRLVGVIDMGATAVRLAIAEVSRTGEIRHIDRLHQAVDLGRDCFTRGAIGFETTERCVAAMKSFRRVLDEAGISDMRNVRAVATSAVREATNRDDFVDRIRVGSGIWLDVIDASEVNRYTYLAVRPTLESEAELRDGEAVVAEIGGGSTEFIVIRRGRVVLAHSCKLGSLRMREMLEDFRAPVMRLPELIGQEMRSALEHVKREIKLQPGARLVALGGDARLAAGETTDEWDPRRIARVDVDGLRELAGAVLARSVEEVADEYHLSYPSAESLGPALLGYLALCESLGRKTMLVSPATLRDGILAAMAGESSLVDFGPQIIESARVLARKYESNMRHVEHVAEVALRIFRLLKDHHRLSEAQEVLLRVASLLHDVGSFISTSAHHKHSMYLISNSEIFGLSSHEVRIAALVARYHRKTEPKATHEEFRMLGREDRIMVCELAAILRVADALDAGNRQAIGRIELELKRDCVVVTAWGTSDLTLERMRLQQKGAMMEQVYGLKVLLKAGRGGE